MRLGAACGRSRKFLAVLLPMLVALMCFSAASARAGAIGPRDVVVASAGMVSTLDPLISTEPVEMEILQCVFDNLFRTDDAGRLVPSLATEVPTTANGGISADGLTYIFHLRPGVKWHDGVPFTAADVAFTVDVSRNPDIPVARRGDLGKIAQITATSDLELTMRMAVRCPGILHSFGLPGILPAHLFRGLKGDALIDALSVDGDFSTHPVGTGPFCVRSWAYTESVTLAANPAYFLGKPGLDSLTWHFAEGSPALEVAAGGANMAHLAAEEFDPKTSFPGLTVTKEPAPGYLSIVFNTASPVAVDKRVRQALAYAIPREYVVRAVGDGYATASDSLIPRASWLYNPTITGSYPCDAARAGVLLNDVGWYMGRGGYRYKDGKRLTVRVTTNADSAVLMTAAQITLNAWRAIGVDATLDSQGFENLESTIDVMNYDALMVEWYTSLDPDLYSFFDSSQLATQARFEGLNYSALASPELDKLLVANAAALDEAQRFAVMQRIQALLNDELPVFVLYSCATYEARPTGLGGFRPSAFENTSFWNAWEWKR